MVKTRHRVVDIYEDEFLARPQILAWAAYPLETEAPERFRIRAVAAIQDLARRKLGGTLQKRQDRTELALARMTSEIRKSGLAAEAFRRQLVNRAVGDFERDSVKKLAASAVVIWGSDQSNKRRDLWVRGRPSFALLAGMGTQLTRQCREWPNVTSMLFDGSAWSRAALIEAEALRQSAISVNHPVAAYLIEFRAVSF